jgi:CDP-diacylglycerol--glycerol-3-phosphate 3-phosphatidyltransferase
VNWPNVISLGRLLLAVAILAVLGWQHDAGSLSANVLWWSAVLTLLVIVLDGVDGYVARTFNQATPQGAVIDILGDRSVEYIYWVAFAVWQWVPLWVPLVVLLRGLWVDGLRALAFKQGYTAFGQTTLLQSQLAIMLVSSRASRWLYAALKAVVFVVLLAHQALLLSGNAVLAGWAEGLTVATVAFCILRGLPVLAEAKRFIAK